MVECLRAEGIPLVFGYPGATIAPFYDRLAASDIRHVLTRTEQGAGHAASGWARTTGGVGVCVATSGPGATNLFTAIATAYSDSIPLVAITGQVATYQLGRDVFQEVDTTGAAEPFTKHCYLVKDAAELPRVFREAFHIASTGRKGPVLIDVPVDVQKQELDFSYPRDVNIRGYKPRFEGHPLQVRRVAEALRSAQRPLLCCGGGVFLAGATEQVKALSEEAGIPVVSTMMGIGVLPPGHPLYYGMLGQTGLRTANTAIRETDLLVLVGARVGDRAITQPGHLENNSTVVHIDIDSAEIGKNVGTTIPLVGDCARVLEQLMDCGIGGDRSGWTTRLDDLRTKERDALLGRRYEYEGVDPARFVRTLCEQLPEDSTYVADVGQNQIWSARNFCARGRFLTTGGMGTMGYAIPAAVGAKLADPARTVLAVCGDGSFQMSMNELATMRQHGGNIKVVVMRNGVLGMVKEIQKNSYGGRDSGIDLAGSPDFGLIAAAYGLEYRLAATTDEAEAAAADMLADEKPFLLECVVDSREGTS